MSQVSCSNEVAEATTSRPYALAMSNATRLVNGTCHHDCPDSCGWIATVETRDDGPVAVKLRGNPEHPYSAGELCPKVNRMLDRVYSPERVLTPLRRTGPKGVGEFSPITWDDALAEIASNLHRVIDTYGAEAVMPMSSAGNQSLLAMRGLSGRFFGHMGASKLTRALCGVTVGAGMAVTNGSSKGLDPLQMVHSKLIIVWGTNTRLTNRHLWPTIEQARSNGARIVVIDPVRTLTAEAIDPARGDQFIQPRPGTDTALILAMMHVIIRDGLVNQAWVDSHTDGFDELRDSVVEWTPERAADETGVDAEVIAELARDYATVRPAAIRTLIGVEHHENGAMFHRALACLPALTGSWADIGGGLSKSTGAWTESNIDGWTLECPEIHNGTPRTLNMSRLGHILTQPHAGEASGPSIHALINWNCNPLVTIPNAEATRRGLERDDLFTVVHDQFITDTARYADIVLPATTQLEADDVVTSWGSLHINYNHAAIEPVGESVTNTEFFRRLSAAMGYTEPALFADDDTLLRSALPTIDIDKLRDSNWIEADYPADGRPFGDGHFDTATGRVQLASDQLEAIGQPRVPTYVAPREGPRGDPELVARFPLQLLTLKQHTRFLNSAYSHLPKHGPAEGAPFLECNRRDADARGLGEGDLVRVWNDRASLQLPIRITERVRPGVVTIPWGWWRSQHLDDQSANSLTNSTLTEWGGGVAYSDTLVEIELESATASSSSSAPAT